MTGLVVGELFAGIGGFGLGLERAGCRVAWQVEINEQARSVLARHWPDVRRLVDVREVGAGTLEAVDVVAGGFPCQDLSIAGRRAGLGGERSGLWWEFHRIVSELRPRWVFAENVPGLLSSDGGRDMGTVLGSLAQLGYGYAYRVLDARFFGLAQRRARVLIVGCLGDGRRAAQVLLEPEGVRGDLAPRGEARADVAGPLGSQPAGGGWRDDLDRAGAFIVSSANSCEVQSHARETDVARALDTSGGFTVGQGGTVVAFDERNITSPDNRSNPQPGSPCHTLNGDAPIVAGTLTFGAHGGFTGQDAERGLRTGHNEAGGVPFIGVPFIGVRRLTPTECERLQGFPDGWNAGQSDSARYRQLGNAVPPPVVEWVGRRLVRANLPREAEAVA